MKILIVNDDGYSAAGINALARTLQYDNEVFVCAPAENKSAAGHSLTLRNELTATRTMLPGCPFVKAYFVSGTPVDCLRIAIGNLGSEPELVLSGINQAPNLGTDIISSGTVAAAKEAAMLGYRAIAVSRDGFDTEYFDDCAEVFRDMLPELLACMDEKSHLLNVNFPHCPRADFKGVRTGYLALQEYPVPFAERIGENGEILYRARSIKLTKLPEDDTSDEKFVRDGYITVTPLLFDHTDYSTMARIAPALERNWV